MSNILKMVSTERYARVIVIHERFGSMVWF